jgi:hypothetical protein
MERIRSWWREIARIYRLSYLFWTHPEVLERRENIQRIRILRRARERTVRRSDNDTK